MWLWVKTAAERIIIVKATHDNTDINTHMRSSSGDPRLQKERKTRLMEPPGGLHSDEDVLQLQFRPGHMCRRVSPIAASAVVSRVLCVFGRGWSLLGGVVLRTG